MTTRPFGLIAQRLRHTGWPSLFLPLLIAAAVLAVVIAPGQTFERTLRAEPPKLTRTQKKIVRNFEKKLQTRFNSKDNPVTKTPGT